MCIRDRAKPIRKYLGGGYEVTASMGHIRDLPQSQLGIDVEHGYAPQYINIKGKEKIIKELKSLAKAVSYTHLDVYKRQRCIRTARWASPSTARRALSATTATRPSARTTPVSYTHLDVYKRQGYEFISADVAMVPSPYTALSDPDDLKKMGILLDHLEDDDDVQNVWHNLENEEDLDR